MHKKRSVHFDRDILCAVPLCTIFYPRSSSSNVHLTGLLQGHKKYEKPLDVRFWVFVTPSPDTINTKYYTATMLVMVTQYTKCSECAMNLKLNRENQRSDNKIHLEMVCRLLVVVI